ncbi:hypothetical protein CKJ90_33300, partial [Klebsiella pneumoniae]
ASGGGRRHRPRARRGGLFYITGHGIDPALIARRQASGGGRRHRPRARRGGLFYITGHGIDPALIAR